MKTTSQASSRQAEPRKTTTRDGVALGLDAQGYLSLTMGKNEVLLTPMEVKQLLTFLGGA